MDLDTTIEKLTVHKIDNNSLNLSIDTYIVNYTSYDNRMYLDEILSTLEPKKMISRVKFLKQISKNETKAVSDSIDAMYIELQKRYSLEEYPEMWI